MKVVTTPMCKKIVEITGLKDFKVNKNPDDEDGDLAILISENKTKMETHVIKLNTFQQIRRSILEVFYHLYETIENVDEVDINENIQNYLNESKIAIKWLDKNKKRELVEKNYSINVRVYSLFLKDIVEDMGFNILNKELFNENNEKYNYNQYEVFFKDLKKISAGEITDFDYIIFPDYFKINSSDLDLSFQEKIVILPSHSHVSKDPLLRAENRYSKLEKLTNI